MRHPIYNPGNVKFSLAQLAKEEVARTRPNIKEQEERARLPTGAPMKHLPSNYVPLKQLSNLKPGFTDDDTRLGPAAIEMTKSDKVNYGQNATAYRNLGILKPLRPNTLDAAEASIRAERAKQREGVKWVKVLPGR